MKQRLLGIIICGILLITLTACDNKTLEEKFTIENTLNDGRKIYFSFEVPYEDDGLNNAFSNNKLSIDDFTSKLDYITIYKDGGSKMYKYNKSKNTFGNEDFYVMVCHTLDNNKDIYVAKYRENLNNVCSSNFEQ